MSDSESSTSLSSRTQDLSGRWFGRLVVTRFAGYTQTRPEALWHCLCICNTSVIVRAASLLSSRPTQSCGCLQKEAATTTRHGHARRGKRTPEHRAWTAMLQRCTNPKNKVYQHYGDRGIAVCSEWFNFEQFLTDMGPRPTQKHTLERKDNNGAYDKTNCIWATHSQQCRNTRRTHFITFQEETLCLADWAKRLGISVKTLANRIRRGWTIERAFIQSIQKHQ